MMEDYYWALVGHNNAFVNNIMPGVGNMAACAAGSPCADSVQTSLQCQS
eukprot:CAMPEP_0118709176 /NCGR_PEP_ID=MMETSP0800-20121206/22442_1 /TAXON_ID=210618 ORGANISM="Striatella unipunctata, Strain CCMP2910" /NCGR_SAMPLE_ID=MMETSP0800 /ASSEMBLY_ACC=CAM_ASM_000638 /LENGTH=48 /DNA_ID= /DNA_START= /DNA_END= /DNA_ORIENTATION=